MAEIKAAPQSYATPTAAPGSTKQYVQETPTWVVVVRGFQALFGLIILGLSGYLIHGLAMDPIVFALVVCLMTWVVVAYALVTERVPSARGAYNIWAVLSLDLLMAIFWLASMGANAANRAAFKFDVDVEYCYNDGSTVSSNHCVVSKRDLERRAAVAGSVGLACMSAIAGLSALVMFLFIATLVFHGHTFRLHQAAKKSLTPDNAVVEMNAQQTPILAAQQAPVPAHAAYTEYQQQTQPQAYPSQPQEYSNPSYPQQPQAYPVQTQPQGYSQSAYPQQVPSPAPVSTPSPMHHELPQSGYNQQPSGPYQLSAAGPYGGAYPPQQQPYVPSPQGTPVQGQPYYPPTQ
ncbi:hypothetical protein B0T25DRAFT_249378 [Lasiosphaeria hispida]|uniref:MARVEL domain-containing protein n=1 Tax=Lasiosphaeria hispida TaxID=260671 RepID=A0AAJ0HFT6_9PEZI|nr:hypothetical protein B0T25DRAFT_249378 [Lasiosphaeria hispida]